MAGETEEPEQEIQFDPVILRILQQNCGFLVGNMERMCDFPVDLYGTPNVSFKMCTAIYVRLDMDRWIRSRRGQNAEKPHLVHQRRFTL